jgi:hypothetical protein
MYLHEPIRWHVFRYEQSPRWLSVCEFIIYLKWSLPHAWSRLDLLLHSCFVPWSQYRLNPSMEDWYYSNCMKETAMMGIHNSLLTTSLFISSDLVSLCRSSSKATGQIPFRELTGKVPPLCSCLNFFLGGNSSINLLGFGTGYDIYIVKSRRVL